MFLEEGGSGLSEVSAMLLSMIVLPWSKIHSRRYRKQSLYEVIDNKVP
jgi:hypothetical protein